MNFMIPNALPDKRRLFLSYGHRDATDLALRLRAELVAAGYSVWQDEERIRAGRAWTEEIKEGLRESDLVVALLSPHSVRRKGWSQNADDQDSVCLDEIEYAVDACKIPVLPVMSMTCEPPFRIFRLQYLDFRAWEESAARYKGLKKKLLDLVAECVETGRAPLRKWERLPEPWDFTAFLAERRRRFTGRTWLFNTLQENLAQNPSPVVLLTGSPGIGKSAFISSLVHANPAGQILAYHCCQATVPTTLSPATFVRSIAAMIAARDETYAGMLENPDTLAALEESKVAADPASAFENVILNLLQKMPAPDSKPRLLVIDALDEAMTSPNSPNLVDLLSTRLGALPSWLKIVATTRDESAVKRRFRTAVSLSLDAAKEDNADDLRTYVSRRLDTEPLRAKAGARRDEIKEKLLEGGNGNFLVVTLKLDALESGLLDIADLDTLAPGLEPLYEEFFDRLYKRAGVEFDPTRKLLQGIIAAQEPPTREELAAVTGFHAVAELPEMLGRLAALVPARDRRYSPFHQTLAEWLTDWNEDEDQPVAGRYHIDRKEGHRLWTDMLLPRYQKGAAAWDAQLLRHLPTHLAGAEMWDEAADVLLDLPFLEAKTGGKETTVFGLLADFDLVLREMPENFERRHLVFLVSEILRLDATFLAEFPASLFQCLWNRGYWHDSEAAKSFLAAPAAFVAPWDLTDLKLNELVETWRVQKEKTSPGFPWLRALRPLPETLGSAQRGIIRIDRDSFGTVSVSPNGSRIMASLPEDGAIGIWDVHSCAQLVRADFTEGRSVHCLRFFPDGPHSGLAAAVTWDGRLIILDEALQTVAEVQGSEDNFGKVAVSPDGKAIATGDWQGIVTLWDADGLTSRKRWQAHGTQITALEFSPCGRFLASGADESGEANMVRVWAADLTEPFQLAETKAGYWVESVCFALDGESLYFGDYKGAVEHWKWRGKGSRSFVRKAKDSPASVVRLFGDRRLICGVGGASDPVPIEIWNLEEGVIERRLHGHLFGIGDIAFIPGTGQFVSAGDATLRIWDPGMPGETQLEILEPEVSWLEFREPEGWAITASETSEKVWIRTLAEGKLLRTLDDHPAPLSGIKLSPDGKTLACGVSDGSVHLWNLDNGERSWQVKYHEEQIERLAFSPDGSVLATGAQDGRVCLVNVADGKLLETYKKHKGDYVQTLAFSNDGKLVASGGLSEIHVWDRENLKIKLKLNKVNHYALWFAPGDEILLAEGIGETPLGWRIATKEPIPAGDELQAAYDALTFRLKSRWYWDESEDTRWQTNLILADKQNNVRVAYFPEVRGGVQYHPGGRIWMNMRSRQISLLKLEGSPEI